MRRILTLTLARFITTKWSGVSECYLKDSCPSDALRAMPTCRLEAPSCWCHSPPPWPPGADSPGAWLQNGTRVSGWAAQGPMGGGTAAVRYGGSRLLCALQHPGRELSPGRTRECVTPRRSSRRKIGRTAETTPRARRVLCGHVRAPRPESDVRSLPTREPPCSIGSAGLDRFPCSEYIYIYNKLSTYDTLQSSSILKLTGYV